MSTTITSSLSDSEHRTLNSIDLSQKDAIAVTDVPLYIIGE